MTFKHIAFCLLLSGTPALGQFQNQDTPLSFSKLPTRWDEALPLGNGQLGALIWQKGSNLRLSLDHAELWDLRPMQGLVDSTKTFKWVAEQHRNGHYRAVQKWGDEPYEREPAPSKIPGAAIEISTQHWGAVTQASLHIKQAEATVTWQNGVKFTSFIHYTKPVGYFRFENCREVPLQLVAPAYAGPNNLPPGGSVAGDALARLGYEQGPIHRSGFTQTYVQKGWGGFEYEVAVSLKPVNSTTWEGRWSISAHYPGKPQVRASEQIRTAASYPTARQSHRQLWQQFWGKSSVSLPDSILQRQYELELYKFGSAARPYAPPISLQAIWTADNGKLPPWKGDFHHDLNTQLSYWPAYTANQLDLAMGYIHHFDERKAVYKAFTRWYFGTSGLNVPGVTTLSGEPMGGWIQYSLSPTVAAWIAQHYYLQWQYSKDTQLLKKSVYPWFKQVATHLEELLVEKEGFLELPLSSSPEIHDNKPSAWFTKTTNFDLALLRFVFEKGAELATVQKDQYLSTRYLNLLSRLRPFAVDSSGLQIAPELSYGESHRHFSHLLAIHPLGLLDGRQNTEHQRVKQKSVEQLVAKGSAQWTGYSWAWLGNLKARAGDADGAAEALRIFAKAFCSPNSFHLNGDQSRQGYSGMTYRPFTLEGNFAFAAGIQEMLLQSHNQTLSVFPAVPATWPEVHFSNLRAEGAFLVSASRSKGRLVRLTIGSEQGGPLRLLTTKKLVVVASERVSRIRQTGGIFSAHFQKGGVLTLKEAN